MSLPALAYSTLRLPRDSACSHSVLRVHSCEERVCSFCSREGCSHPSPPSTGSQDAPHSVRALQSITGIRWSLPSKQQLRFRLDLLSPIELRCMPAWSRRAHPHRAPSRAWRVGSSSASSYSVAQRSLQSRSRRHASVPQRPHRYALNFASSPTMCAPRIRS